ncbi:bacteriophage holin [Hymenobacter pini]|uniref:bacteriophage holin n=1 Tax=Hymenobacter pini TaxID=2880879 RepID=UPI001CF29B72|nr:bacteriophage holin [Hymenobacter pini]MCA8831965.1 bacteriophage holin [Hymenobacter pini]
MRAVFQTLVLAVTSPRMVETVTTGLVVSPWALLIRQYLFDDWQFLGFLMVLIVVDTITGVFRSWRQRQVSSRAFSRIFTKVLIYLALLVLAHVMTNFTVHGKVNVLFQWFDTFIYSAMMAREALSLLENLAGIEPTLIPKALLKRLAQFSEDPATAGQALLAPQSSIPASAPPAEAALSTSPIEEGVIQ